MAEIIINNVIQFDNGFILKNSQPLTSGNVYYLRINDGSRAVDKTYIVVNQGDTIIDSWGSYVPTDGNVCFTLSDTQFACPPLGIVLEVV